MPRSSSKSAPKKAFKFSSEVTLVNSGRIEKKTNFTSEEVDKLCNPTKKLESRKKIRAKVYENRIIFKEKLPGEGNRRKKLFRYLYINHLEKPPGDELKVFLQYVKPDKAYYFVLEFSEAGNVKDFIKLVQTHNSDTKSRHASLNGKEPIAETSSSRRSSENFRSSSPDHFFSPQQEGYYKYSSDTTKEIRKSSSSSVGILNDVLARTTFVTSWDKDCQYSDSDKKNIIQNNVYKPNRSKHHDAELNKKTGLITKYTYIGPEDAENSTLSRKNMTNRPPQNSCARSTRPRESNHLRGSLDDNLLIKSGFSSVRSNRSRKSRQLPLSDAEKIRTGWHSDIMFVTPKPGGIIDITDDGPIMLYSASRANFENSSEEDDDSDVSNFVLSSSSSTLSVENDMYRSYSREVPMRP